MEFHREYALNVIRMIDAYSTECNDEVRHMLIYTPYCCLWKGNCIIYKDDIIKQNLEKLRNGECISGDRGTGYTFDKIPDNMLNNIMHYYAGLSLQLPLIECIGLQYTILSTGYSDIINSADFISTFHIEHIDDMSHHDLAMNAAKLRYLYMSYGMKIFDDRIRSFEQSLNANMNISTSNESSIQEANKRIQEAESKAQEAESKAQAALDRLDELTEIVEKIKSAAKDDREYVRNLNMSKTISDEIGKVSDSVNDKINGINFKIDRINRNIGLDNKAKLDTSGGSSSQDHHTPSPLMQYQPMINDALLKISEHISQNKVIAILVAFISVLIFVIILK